MFHAINGYKECPGCKQSLEATEEFWYRNKANKDGWQRECRDCLNKRAKKYYETHKEKKAEYHKKYYETHKEQEAKRRKEYRETHRSNKLKRNFGITLEQYDAMFEAQGGVCAVCHKPETAKHQSGTARRLAVDHNHETGEVRGLLCNKCNVSLGYMDEDLERILSLAEYVREHKQLDLETGPGN